MQFISYDCVLQYMQINVMQDKISTINPATGKVIASYFLPGIITL
jgi:hypothetical protein